MPNHNIPHHYVIDGGEGNRREPYSDEISIKPLLRVLWGYRRVAAFSVSIILIIFLIGAVAFYLNSPFEREASLGFQALFEGADNGKYPNGLPFSRSDILSTSVLNAVYDTNDLKRYSSYPQFKNRLYILESSPELELLQLEYRSKLDDPRISAVDRSKLESEYREKQQALRVAQYSLNFSNPGGRTVIPEPLMNKLLNDILAVWAEQAVDEKGVLNYHVRIYSSNLLLKDLLDTDDYTTRLDMMRDKINQIIGNIDQLLTLPGANLIRVGNNKISLPEIRANLEDVRRFSVEPLLLNVHTAGPRDPGQLMRYLDARIAQLKLENQEATGKLRTLQEAIRTYQNVATTANVRDGASGVQTPLTSGGAGSVIPQLGESFLDRLIAMSNQNAELPYRQHLTDEIISAGEAVVSVEKEMTYYQDLATSLRGSSFTSRGMSADQTADLQKKFANIQSLIVGSLEQINAVYKELSSQNLNPRSNLYAITNPFSVRTQRVITIRTIGLYGLLTLMLALLIVPLGCIVHHYFRTDILPYKTVPPSNDELEEKSVETKARSMSFTE